jgi:RNA polymerase sigma factor (sigma-70 family)
VLERADQANPPQDPSAEPLLLCWAKQRGELLRFCRRSLGRADGEEAFSRATVSMLRTAASLEDLRRPSAWLQEVVRRACIDVYRERTRRGRYLVLAGANEDLGELETFIHTSARDPERTLLERESLSQTESAIRALPPSLRAPLLLRAEEELSYADMAALLVDSKENLRKRVQIARQTVRRLVLLDAERMIRAPAAAPRRAEADESSRKVGLEVPPSAPSHEHAGRQREGREQR